MSLALIERGSMEPQTPHGAQGHKCHDGDARCLAAAREFGKWERLSTLGHRGGGECGCGWCREVYA